MGNLILLLILSGCNPAMPVFYESVDMALSVFPEVIEEIIENEVEDEVR